MDCPGCQPRGLVVLTTADQVRDCPSCRAAVLPVLYRARCNSGTLTDQDARWAAAVDAGTVAAAHRIGRAALAELGASWPEGLAVDRLISTFDQLSAVALGPRAPRRGRSRGSK